MYRYSDSKSFKKHSNPFSSLRTTAGDPGAHGIPHRQSLVAKPTQDSIGSIPSERSVGVRSASSLPAAVSWRQLLWDRNLLALVLGKMRRRSRGVAVVIASSSPPLPFHLPHFLLVILVLLGLTTNAPPGKFSAINLEPHKPCKPYKPFALHPKP
jgi:hypothetical protein